MEKRKIVILITALLIITNSNAQFLSKLKKRAEEAAKESVARKVEEKTERETEKTFDSVFNNDGKLFKNNKSKVLDSYVFDYQYVMEVTNDDDITEIVYYLSQDNPYMGTLFSTGKNQSFFTVMDLPNSAIHTFMDMGGQKSMTSIKVNYDDFDGDELNTSKVNVVSTGQTKKILGYLCEEFQVTGPKLSGKVWVTQEADVSFQKAFNQQKSNKNKGIDQSWFNMVEGLVLEMNMIDYSRKKPKPIKMVCTKLSEQEFTIETLQYK